jgi:hypothetical protein
MHHRIALLGAALSLSTAAMAADPVAILFVGNSYTFGRVDPVLSYNAANVHDLTAAFNAVSSAGSNPWEPHPWGGVPGIFKEFTVEAGLNYDVSISARNAATLRGQFLNTANAAWDLRGNVASRVWNTVVLQEQSDAALPAGKGKNANLAQFNAYADQFERFIHDGAAQTYTEAQLYGSLAACQATGATTTTCNTVRNIPQNPNASAATQVYLTETWARPDMVFAHRITTPDPTTPDGRPIVDTSSAGGNATLYYPTLAAMTADLHASFAAKASSNPRLAGVVPVGDAFQLAVDQQLVKTGASADANGVYVPNQPGEPMNLWWDDYPREQVRLLSRRAGAVRHDHRSRPAPARRERTGGDRPRHQQRRRRDAAKDRRAGAGNRRGSRAADVGAPRRARAGRTGS